jgi:hypothetical protein
MVDTEDEARVSLIERIVARRHFRRGRRDLGCGRDGLRFFALLLLCGRASRRKHKYGKRQYNAIHHAQSPLVDDPM